MSNDEEDEILAFTPEIAEAYRIEDEKLKRALEKEREINNRTYLNQKSLQAAQPRSKEYTIPSRTIKGFVLRVRPSGDMSFYFYYRPSGHGSAKIKIGKPETMSLDKAREIALEYWFQVSNGEDPRYDRDRKRNQTLGIVYKEYDEEHGAKSLSSDWRKQSASLFHRFLDGSLGNKPIAEIDVLGTIHLVCNNRICWRKS